MATQRHGFEVPLLDFAANLLLQREAGRRAQLIAEQLAQLEPGCDVVVYVVEDQDNPSWTPKALRGDLRVGGDKLEFQAGTLGMLAQAEGPLVLHASQLAREDYAHLDVRRTLASLAYVPLLAEGVLVGTIELISYERSLSNSTLETVSALAQLAAPAIAAALAYEGERNGSLQSITRVTQMYDLEKVFNSHLEMDELLATIAAKVREVMSVESANVWMVEEDTVRLMSQDGGDASVQVGARQGPGDGIAGKISDDGEPVLIADADDERLRARNAGAAENGGIFSLLAVPLMDGEALVGVIEVVNRVDGRAFDDDDQFVLSSISETASNALHNASLLQAERKLEILHALVKVSGEITSTLNLERVLQTVVNGPSAVIPYERAAIALEERGRVKLKSVSGIEQLNPADPQMERLGEVLEWAAFLDSELLVAQHGEGINTPREETREKFRRYFQASGMRGFYALPLGDEEGKVGVLSYESSDPDFLTEAHFEMIRVLAAQATVAIRNASLYREVPFIGVLEPLLHKKQKFFALEKRRRVTLLAAAAAVVVFLAAFPFPMRVEGNARVSPSHLAKIEPEVAGVVRQVYVHEGQHVTRGQVLADLEDWDYRAALAGGEAKYQTALAEMNRALARNDGSEAGVQRVQANYWQSEVERDRERLEKTHLRSPIDGVVTTPHVQDLVGRELQPGDQFAQVVDDSVVTVDVAVDEPDLSLVRGGARGWVKLDGFPARTFRGVVNIISPRSDAAGDTRVFYARLQVPNPGNLMRAGMRGRAKLATGWRPVGYVFFRRPAMWVYAKLWSWFGW